jgi:hypothetical protein
MWLIATVVMGHQFNPQYVCWNCYIVYLFIEQTEGYINVYK